MKRIVLLLGIAALFLAIVMVSPVAVAQEVSGITDGTVEEAGPGVTYIAYNFTYTDTSDAATLGTNLTSFNISEWNTTADGWTGNNASFDDIDNVSLWNATGATEYIGHASKSDIHDGFWINISLGNYTVPPGNSANILVNITLNTTDLIDGKEIAFNATFNYVWNATGTTEYPESNTTSDLAVETIEVLDTFVGPSNTTAWEGDTNALCGNVTITPGNTTVTQYLKKITFNNTATAPRINGTYIESFGLWNDSDASKTFDATVDYLINTSTPTEGSNVTFDLTALATDNRTILPTGGTFFLTMNITTVAHTGKYNATIFAQNITINQSSSNTGNDTDTIGVTTLWVDPADVDVYDAPLKHIAPGKAYAAYNITYYENASDATGANLTWFNVSEMNATVPNNASLDDITNVSVWNSTADNFSLIAYNTTPPDFPVNLSNTFVPDNSTYNLTIMINTSRTMDTGDWFKNVSINATLYDNETVSAGGLTANDPKPERIIRVEINEIMYDPASVQGPEYNEWVELHNTNITAAINVSSWNITDSAGKSLIISSGTNISANGYIVIANNKSKFTQYYRWVNESLVLDRDTAASWLNQGGDTIILKNDTEAEIDSVNYTDTWGGSDNGYTLERNGDNYVTQANMWSESNSYAGTPLDINSIIDPEPYITDYFSHDTTQTTLASTTFGVKANKTVNVTWYRNGRVVHTETGVAPYSWSNYTANAIIGLWNITATISGSSIYDTMTWIWDCGRIYDSPESLVSPGKSYIAYYVLYQENNTAGETDGAKLTWLNVTGMNTTISDIGDIGDIVNVSVWNTTNGTYIGHNATRLSASPYFTVNLSDEEVANNATYNLTINLTVATIDSWEKNNISINATLYDNETNNLGANDPAPEYTQYSAIGYPHTAAIFLDANTYGPGSTAGISVEDSDYNNDTTFEEKVVARAWTDYLGNATANYIEVRLAETGVDTGVFNGSVTFDQTATSHDDTNDVLAIRGGQTVYVQLKDNQDSGGAVQLINDTATFELTRDGTVDLNRTTYNTSVTGKVTVDDTDLDTTDGKDTVDVTINSTQNLTEAYLENITLTLTETKVHSGIFENTFNFTTIGSSSGSTLRVNGSTTTMVFDTITATYIDEKNASYVQNTTTDVAAFNNTHTGSVSLNKTVYTNGDVLNVTLYDPDLNTNISAIDWVLNTSNYTLMFINTTNLSAYSANPSGYDSENITNITETEINTGYFTNTTITLNATTGVNKDNGELNVTPGGGFAVVYFDYCDEYGTNYSQYAPNDVANSTTNATAATLQTADVSVWWNESGNISGPTINVTSDNVWGENTVARISIDDADGGGKELSATANDTIYVLVNSTAPDADVINITLEETGVNTGVFNGTLYFGTASSEGTRTIKVNDSDEALVNTTINVNFNDTKNAAEDAEWRNVSFTHWWAVNGTAKVKNGTGAWGTPTSNVIFYNTTTATVQVTDPDRNNDTTVYNKFTVTMVSWNASGQIDTLMLILNETGNNTGLFYNDSLNFSEVEWGLPTKLNVSDGCSINVSYQDTNTSLGNVSTWFNYTYGTYKKTRTGDVGLWELNPTVGESGNITLTDYDRNITAGYDTVTVDVWSNTTGEAGKITVTLNQTSPTAETFNGTLNFSTATTDETLNQIKASDGDNITIEYVDPLDINGTEKTITNSSAWVTVYYTGTIAFDKATYNPTETALITLNDADLNLDTTVAETVTGIGVNSSTGDTAGFNITLKETGADTGVFERAITFTTTGNSDATARILRVNIGDTIYTNYTDANNATGASQLIVANASIQKVTADSLTLDRAFYNASHTVTITINDTDLNNDTTLAEVYYAEETPYSNVSVNSTSDTTGFNVSIEETGENTGNFTGWFIFKVGGPSSSANRELNVSNGDTINVTYINTVNATGVQETVVTTATFDNLAPVISNLSADVSLAKEDTIVTITVDVSDNISGLAATPTVTVNDNAATYVSVSDNTYTYSYTVSTTDTEGYATVNVSATDNATNVATDSSATLFKIDLSAPTFSGWTPAESAVVGKNTTISVNYTDAYSSINTSSVVMKVNGVDVTADATVTATGVSYAATNLESGANNVSVSVADELGYTNTTLWNFTVDEAAPRITDEIPNKTNDTTPTIGATITDPETGVNVSTIVLKVAGDTISSEKWTFTWINSTSGELRYTPTVSYPEGEYSVELSVKDNASLEATKIWQFTVDQTEPSVSVSVDKPEVNVSENVTITVTATDTVTAAESLTVTATVDTTSVELTRDGSNWTGIWSSPDEGTYTVTAKATDEAGNSAMDTTTVEVEVVKPLMEGDVDMNGYVDISDAMFIAQYTVDARSLNESQLKCADTTDEGIVDISDAMHIAQYTVDPDGSLGVLYKPLWESPADDDMLEPVPYA